MGEIKSTMDLVMEKAGKLEISPEEREQFKREEVKGLVQRLFNRYFIHGDQKDLSGLKKDLQEAREGVEEVLTELLISSYSFEAPSPTNLMGLDLVQGDRGREIAKALQELTSRYQRERDGELQRVKEGLRAALARRGISGSSVEPNPDSDPRWADFTEQLNKKYGEHKKEILDRLI